MGIASCLSAFAMTEVKTPPQCGSLHRTSRKAHTPTDQSLDPWMRSRGSGALAVLVHHTVVANLNNVKKFFIHFIETFMTYKTTDKEDLKTSCS